MDVFYPNTFCELDNDLWHLSLTNDAIGLIIVMNKWDLISADKLDRLLLKNSPVVKNTDSTDTDVAQENEERCDRDVEAGQAVHVVSRSQRLFH